MNRILLVAMLAFSCTGLANSVNAQFATDIQLSSIFIGEIPRAGSLSAPQYPPRFRLEMQLEHSIEAIKEIVPLKKQVVDAIELAGRGDIDRFYKTSELIFTEVDRGNLPRLGAMQVYNQMNRNLFSRGSLYRKVLNAELDEASMELLSDFWNEDVYETAEELIDTQLREITRILEMTAEQTTRLRELLTEQLDGDVLAKQHGGLLVDDRIASIADEKIDPLLTPFQKRWIEHVRKKALLNRMSLIELDLLGEDRRLDEDK